MSTHAVTANAHTGEGRTAAERSRRVRINRFGLWLFFISDGLLFGIMAAARFAIADTDVDEHLSQVLGLGLTSILLASSLTAFLADAAISNGNIRRGRLLLLATVVLGSIFLGGVVVEWSIAEFSVSEPYGTAFFSMTGMHATHVASGLLFLMLAWVLAGRGRFNDGHTFGAQGVVMYWHFVDVVWVFFYPILYLLQ